MLKKDETFLEHRRNTSRPDNIRCSDVDTSDTALDNTENISALHMLSAAESFRWFAMLVYLVIRQSVNSKLTSTRVDSGVYE